MTIQDFFTLCNAHPWAYIALIFNLGVVFVNGWTDGPNSIATAVTTRAIRPKAAVIMCAILNVVGVVTIGALSIYLSKFIGGDVSQTIASLVNWGEASIDKVLCGKFLLFYLFMLLQSFFLLNLSAGLFLRQFMGLEFVHSYMHY